MLLENAHELIDHGYRFKSESEPPPPKPIVRISMMTDEIDESSEWNEMRSWDYPGDFTGVPKLESYFQWLEKKLPGLRELMNQKE